MSSSSSSSQKSRIRVDNLCCGREATLIKRLLEPVEGVESVKVNVIGRAAVVEFREPAESAALVRILNASHLGASIAEMGESSASSDASEEKRERRAQAVAALTSLALVAGLGLGFWHEEFLYVVAGAGAARLGVRAVRVARDVNTLMLLALCGAVYLREMFEAATLVVALRIADAVEEEALRRARRALRGATARTIESMVSKVNGERVPASTLVVGDEVLVRAGDRIPTDGVATRGKATVDESSLTGESVPVEKRKEASVVGGTVVVNGFLGIRVSKLAATSTAAELGRAVDEAQASTSPTQDAVAKFATWFTPVIAVAAFGVFLAGGSLRMALGVLVAACPCALLVAAPAPNVAAMGAAASRGIVVKSATALEAMAKVSVVALDKTGTLTQGRCRVVRRRDVASDARDALVLAASVETKSTHPLAAAVVNLAVGCVDAYVTEAADVLSDDIKDFEMHEGEGVAATVDDRRVRVGTAGFCGAPEDMEGQLFVAVDDELKLVLWIDDPIREEARPFIQRLAARGRTATMITGDQRAAAEAVVRELDAANLTLRAAMKPRDKLDWVRAAQRKDPDRETATLLGRRRREGRRIVLMLGDGINDGPALAAADVGVAMGAGGSALAVDAADVVILDDNLHKLADALDLAARARSIVLQNLAIALILKSAALLSLLFAPHLWLVVAADLLALLLVLLNGLRPLASLPDHTILSDKQEDDDLLLLETPSSRDTATLLELV
ncbi:hypothetical protein CTAYLR_007309 [Chrysophaeum taylorii]|uniref:HMA domain-containing protein n=1 Tax=Chrysophaeum taylorii TaxID=2483200 RepID=A0AAD7UKK7_9STRA|nr:hypothetical protein CTAYLR_007309 [Chrysophaeum taylorii]